jgi:phosphatidylglycerophosphatase A
MSDDPKVKRRPSAPSGARSNIHLLIGCVMFLAIVLAGIMLERAGRETEAIIATLSFYSAMGIGLVTAIVKLSGVEQTANTVERRTNGDMRAMVRDEIRAALAEAMPGRITATQTQVED